MQNDIIPAIWWIRRDLRLSDNQALSNAVNASSQVIPLFILDPILLNSKFRSKRRIAFLFAGLNELEEQLRQKGSRLIVRGGEPLKVFSELYTETHFSTIYAEEDFSPFARKRDAAIAEIFDLRLCGGLTILHPNGVVKADGSPYTIFTPFSRTWRERFSPAE
jgi:deoxyribodipyrimidine photo-lyase